MTVLGLGSSLLVIIIIIIIICRYFGKFLLQGVNRNWRQSGFFYLAPSLTLGGCLLVNP